MMMAIAWNKLSHGQSLHISRCGYKFEQLLTSLRARQYKKSLLCGVFIMGNAYC